MSGIYQSFIDKAELLKPKLNKTVRKPIWSVLFEDAPNKLHGIGIVSKKEVQDTYAFREKGDQVILDFDEHMVGHLKLDIKTVGSPQDAPLKLKLTFGEMPCELYYKPEEYDGWLCETWLQEEIIYVDYTPKTLVLERRHSFRYVKIEVLGISRKNTFELSNISCEATTSASFTPIESEYVGLTGDIDKISQITLRDCMQDVFEDGPKRDQRLWLGDLRLQALVNYHTFKNYDLVKRCLYLFAGTVGDNEKVPSCLFIKPYIHGDDIFLYDYYLLFVPTLYEYYEASRDLETLVELWPIARKQIELALEETKDGMVKDDDSWWAFIDWRDDLHKQLAAQGVLIYTINYALKILDVLKVEDSSLIRSKKLLVEKASHCYDTNQSAFVSGPENQISWASQIWMTLSGVANQEQVEAMFNRELYDETITPINTPYLMHYYVEALFQCGQNEKALNTIQYFWGAMVKQGANTFWEVFNVDDPSFSPYGSPVINSYCHAWSCTPSYFYKVNVIEK